MYSPSKVKSRITKIDNLNAKYKASIQIRIFSNITRRCIKSRVLKVIGNSD